VKRRLQLAWTIAALATLLCTLCAAEQGQQGKPFKLKLTDAPIGDALRSIAKAMDREVILGDKIPKDLHVTMDISAADPEAAFDMVCKAAGLVYQRFGPLNAYIMGPAPTATVGGSQVPIVGAVTVPSGEAALRDVVRRLAVAAAPSPYPGVAMPASFKGDEALVDLEVKDASIRETMEKISRASGVPIKVVEGVPGDLRITARIYRLALRDLLSKIVGKANLTYSVSRAGGEGNVPEIYVTPKPQLEVTGPGVVATAVSAEQFAGGTMFTGGSTLGTVRMASSSPFEGDDRLVDLDIKDATIGEAMDRLSQASGIAIRTVAAVPRELRITARIYRAPLGQVLTLIVQQANLHEVITQTKDEEGKRRPEIYIVPKPQLEVSGSGSGP